MKTIITISLMILLCSIAMGQTGTLKLDSAITNKWATSGSSVYKLADTTIKTNWSRYWMLNVDTKPLMTISDVKPDKSYEVWIDKKAIIWTSDSTFILKRKP